MGVSHGSSSSISVLPPSLLSTIIEPHQQFLGQIFYQNHITRFINKATIILLFDLHGADKSKASGLSQGWSL